VYSCSIRQMAAEMVAAASTPPLKLGEGPPSSTYSRNPSPTRPALPPASPSTRPTPPPPLRLSVSPAPGAYPGLASHSPPSPGAWTGQVPGWEPPAAWWVATSFNARPLLKKAADREAAAAAAAAEAAIAAAEAAAAEAGNLPGASGGSPSPGQLGATQGSTSRNASPPRTTSPSKAAEGGKTPSKPSAGSGQAGGTVGAGGKADGKAGAAKKSGKAGGGKPGVVKAEAKVPPLQRWPGVFCSQQEMDQAEAMAALLLSVPLLDDAALLLSRLGVRLLARVLNALVVSDPSRGAAAAAQLLEALPPVAAVSYLFDMFDLTLPLMPTELRAKLLGAMRPEVVKQLDRVQREINAAALLRSRQIRAELQTFAAHTWLSSAQLSRVLRVLSAEQDRGTAVVSLWSRVVDRAGLYDSWQLLRFEEQRALLSRLGFWHVWGVLGRPYGLHWYLDLTDPEQRELAKELVKLASRETQRAKEAAKAAGMHQSVAQLGGLLGNGLPLTIPEDDKMWSMLESSYQSLEFEYAPSAQQVQERQVQGVVRIVAHWRWYSRQARVRAEQAAAAAAVARLEQERAMQAEEQRQEQQALLDLAAQELDSAASQA
ncbi:hypothetical protein QJQ45_030343, partial [Haematococcus lacustris]